HWVSPPKSLDRSHYFTASAVSRFGDTPAFRRTNTCCVTRNERSPNRDHQWRYPAAPRRRQQYALFAAGRKHFTGGQAGRGGEPDEVELYRPWAQENFPFVVVAVRSNLQVDTVTKLVQSAVNAVDRGLAIAIPQSMGSIVAQALGQTRLMMWLLGIFAGVALLLATIGIYGAVAYTVEQRTGEIGIRMALGAQTRDVLRLIVSQGMKPVLIGLITGLAAALALGRLLTSQLYQVSAHNPVLLIGTAATLGAAALLACLLPA